MKRWLKILIGIAFSLAIFLVGAYLWYGGEHVVLATVVDDRTLPSLRVADHRVHLETFGQPEDPLVIVLHGGPAPGYRYLLPLKALSDTYRVVFYDQLGSGLSERVPDAQLTLENFLDELHRIILHFSPDATVRLVGDSWGAVLASAYLSRHPQRVSHAVLAEPGALTPALAEQFLTRTGGLTPPLSWPLIKTGFAVAMQALHVDGPDDDARLDYFLFNVATADVPGHPLAGFYCGRDLSTASLPSWRWGARANAAVLAEAAESNDLSDNLERFPRKVLIMASSCNSIVGEDVQRQHADLFRNAELAVVEDAGHTMIGERPEESLALIRTYLAEARPSQAREAGPQL